MHLRVQPAVRQESGISLASERASRSSTGAKLCVVVRRPVADQLLERCAPYGDERFEDAAPLCRELIIRSPAGNQASLLQATHRFAHGLSVDARRLGDLLYGGRRLLAGARKQPRLCRIDVDTCAVHPLLVCAPALVATRDHAQHSLQLPLRVGVTRRGESLAEPFRRARLPQRNVWKEQSEGERDHADDGCDLEDR